MSQRLLLGSLMMGFVRVAAARSWRVDSVLMVVAPRQSMAREGPGVTVGAVLMPLVVALPAGPAAVGPDVDGGMTRVSGRLERHGVRHPDSMASVTCVLGMATATGRFRNLLPSVGVASLAAGPYRVRRVALMTVPAVTRDLLGPMASHARVVTDGLAGDDARLKDVAVHARRASCRPARHGTSRRLYRRRRRSPRCRSRDSPRIPTTRWADRTPRLRRERCCRG